MSGSIFDVPLLDEANAAFIQNGVAVYVASRDVNNVPSLVRGYGCRVSADRRRVTVFLSAPASTAVLKDIRSEGVVAVAFSYPPTHQTLQLKASDARVEPLQPGDLDRIDTQRKGFMRSIREIGYVDPFVSSFEHAVIPEYIAVTFTPVAAFVQTPGPKAGEKLGGAA